MGHAVSPPTESQHVDRQCAGEAREEGNPLLQEIPNSCVFVCVGILVAFLCPTFRGILVCLCVSEFTACGWVAAILYL